MRVLALVTDAFGGHGGIAQYNRHLLSAVAGHPACIEVVALPRVVPRPVGELPNHLEYITTAVDTRVRYAATALIEAQRRSFDLIICGHVQLLPVAFTARAWRGTPIVLVTHGIEAWQPRSLLHAALVRRVELVASVSRVTLDRLVGWSRIDVRNTVLLPNAIDLRRFARGPKSAALVAKHGLGGKRVLLTLGRMDTTERAKGFDEVLDAMPGLVATIPNMMYIAAGDGTDRARLQAKAARLGLGERVVFPGAIAESVKADYYRLADAYVMPSHGEGFGIVFLEALACGIPVLASILDGGREAVRDGAWGELVDPRDRAAVTAGIERVLARPRGFIPRDLTDHDLPTFVQRCHALVDRAVSGGTDAGVEER